MGKINQDINEYITSYSKQGIKLEFCHGIKPQLQEGQTCKLIAGAVVQEYLHLKGHSLPALPLRKQGVFKYSLRQRAKQTVNSQVGEIYGPEQIKNVFDYNNFETTSYYIADKEVYEKFLVQSLQQKQPVILYFDVTPKVGPEEKQGVPILAKGEMEHAAVISGYYYFNTQLHLIIAQWGDFYDVLFDEVFDSTSQLSKVKSQEHYQKYYPIPGFFNSKKWIQKQQMEFACDYICDNQQGFMRDALSFLSEIWPKDQERLTQPPKDISACLANVLTVINSDFRKIDLEEFSEFQMNMQDEKEGIQVTNRIYL